MGKYNITGRKIILKSKNDRRNLGVTETVKIYGH